MLGKRIPVCGLLLVVLAVAACSGASAFTVVPPCTPAPNSTVDPCAPQEAQGGHGGSMTVLWSETPSGVKAYLDTSPRYMAHLVVRATYLPDTVRCIADGVLYREQTWERLPVSDVLPPITAVDCYADIRANEYYVGSGPAELTVQVAWEWYAIGRHDEVVRDKVSEELEDVLTNGGVYWNTWAPEGGLPGKERILFLAPALDAATQAWRVYGSWRVERMEDETVVAVNPARWRFLAYPEFDYEAHKATLEMALPSFKAAAQQAHKERMVEHGGRIGEATDLPMVVSSAGELGQYYRAVGAYSHADGPPDMPPAAPILCSKAVPQADANPGLVTDCTALVALWDTLTQTGGLNWRSHNPIGTWDGVTVGGTPKRVQHVQLRNKGLAGTLPAALGNMALLQTLELSGNAFTGGIPTELGNLAQLKTLAAEYNALTGGIPTELGKLTKLTRLALTGNRLTGAIPTQLGSLSKLGTLDLASNRLTGQVPTQLGNLRAMTYLSLGGNRLTGAVPTELGNITTLRVLYLDNNTLTGGIPTELGRLTSMSVLVLKGNNLTGAIPAVLGNMTNLEELSLQNNGLTGAIPASLGALADLEYLYLAGNKLTGCIPAGLRTVDNNDLSKLRLTYCEN